MIGISTTSGDGSFGDFVPKIFLKMDEFQTSHHIHSKTEEKAGLNFHFATKAK